MEFESVIEGKNIQKGFKNFTLNIPELKIPKGFATALIGENGAGKTTLLNILAGIRIDNKGTLKYFDAFDQNDRENNPEVKERIGYTGTENYFLPHWTVDQVRQLSKLLYKNFDEEKYKAYYDELAISANGSYEGKKKISELSDGTKTKLTLAAILSR